MAQRHLFALSEAALNFSLGPEIEDTVHAQFYALHPFFLGTAGDVLESLPAWLGAAPRAVLSFFLAGFLYLPGHLSRQASVQVSPAGSSGPWQLAISTQEHPEATANFRRAIRRLGKSKALGLSPIRSLTRTTPHGFSGHLSGTLPMRPQPKSLETDTHGCLADNPRVIVADSAAFPSLASQNPTLTVVANAFRVTSLLGHV